MSAYKRSTKQCQVNELRQDLLTVIQNHLKKYHLEGEEMQALVCIETTNVRLGEPGFFDRLRGNLKETNVTAMLVTPRIVLWAFTDLRKLVFALSSRLEDIKVRDYEETLDYKAREDCGLELSGPANNGPKKGTYIIGLGPEEAAVEFRRILKDAVRQAHQP